VQLQSEAMVRSGASMLLAVEDLHDNFETSRGIVLAVEGLSFEVAGCAQSVWRFFARLPWPALQGLVRLTLIACRSEAVQRIALTVLALAVMGRGVSRG
jgi:hypothetical protein